MFKFFLFAQSLSLATFTRGVVLFSELTPAAFKDQLTSVLLSSDSQIETYEISDQALSFFQEASVDLIFDFTYSFTHQLTLLNFCQYFRIPYFTPSERLRKDKVHKWAFYLHQDSSFEAEAMKALLSHLEINDCFLISTSDEASSNLASQIDSFHTVPSVSPRSVFYEYISGTVKSSGNWKIIGISDSEGCLKMFQSIEEAKMYRDLLIFITNGKGSLNPYRKGVVSVIEEGLETATNEGEYEAYAILKAFNIVKDLDYGRAREDLENLTLDHAIPSNYSIVNFKSDFVREKVGTIDKHGVHLLSEIEFPGNETTQTSEKPVIRIGANLDFMRYGGDFDGSHFVTTKALIPMVSIINSDDSLLKNFELELVGTNCNSVQLDYQSVKNCMTQYKDQLEHFYIENIEESMIKQNIQIMKELGVDILHGSALIDKQDLYDKEKYPDMLITTPHFQYFYSMLPYILASFGWKNILLYIDHITTGHEPFIENCKTLGIEILNKNQKFNGAINHEDKDEYRDYIQEIIDLKCRIIVTFQAIPNNLEFANLLYDYGFRKGDLVMITMFRLSYVIDEPIAFTNREKALEIMDGSISVYFLEFVEEYGEALQKQLAQMLYPESTAFSCFLVDTMLLAVRTIDMLIDLEFDYDNNDLMNKYIRKQYFKGCSGTVAIDSTANGPRDIRFGIYNFFVKNGNWTENFIGTYHIGTLIPLKLDREIFWPNGSTDIPTDLILDYPCENSSVMSSASYVVINSVLGIGCVLSLLVVWGQYDLPVEDLECVQKIKFEDGVLLILPLVESFQYIALGSEFNSFFALFGSIAILDSELVEDFEYWVFWRYYGMFLGIVIVWIGNLLTCISKCFPRIPELLKDYIYYIGYIYFPFIAQYGFIPCILNLMKIFDCDVSFHYDCTLTCWRGIHLFLAIVVSATIVIYMGLALIFKAEVDHNMQAVNVKTVPKFYCLKCFFHLTLVIVHMNKKAYSAYFELVYLGLFVLWLVIVYNIKLTNYKRFDFWQRLIVLAVTSNKVLIVVYSQVKDFITVFVLVQVIVICAIGLFGLLVQRKHYPSMLYRKPGSDIHKLIKFAFGRGVKESDITMRQFSYVANEARVDLPRRREIIT